MNGCQDVFKSLAILEAKFVDNGWVFLAELQYSKF